MSSSNWIKSFFRKFIDYVSGVCARAYQVPSDSLWVCDWPYCSLKVFFTIFLNHYKYLPKFDLKKAYSISIQFIINCSVTMRVKCIAYREKSIIEMLNYSAAYMKILSEFQLGFFLGFSARTMKSTTIIVFISRKTRSWRSSLTENVQKLQKWFNSTNLFPYFFYFRW